MTTTPGGDPQPLQLIGIAEQQQQQQQQEQLQQPAAVSGGVAQGAGPSRELLWKAAIKLPMYSVGYIPVLVGGACVFLQTGTAPFAALLGFMLAAVLVIAWLNLSNDFFDAETGVDVSKPESVVNLTGNRALVGGLAAACLAAGGGLLALLLSAGGDPRPAAMLAFSIACGYVYQGPPFRLSYRGLGEPLCFMAFGPSATTAFFLAMLTKPAAATATTAAPTAAAGAGAAAAAATVAAAPFPLWLSWAPPAVWACSVLVGITTTIILFTSHFHQIEGDTRAGKRSPLVRLGVVRGLSVLKASVASTYAGALAACAFGALPWHVLLALALGSLAPAREMLAYAQEHHQVPARIAQLKRFTCWWHIWFGVSLSAGLVAGRLLPLA